MDGRLAPMIPPGTPAYPLAISLFGSCQVTYPDKPVADFRSNKGRALLAYLLLAGSAPVARTSLTDLLWHGYAPHSARTNLRQVLSNLRSVLAPLNLLHSNHQTIQLIVDPALVWCDALLFDELLDACQRHVHPSITTCPTCQHRLHQARALYKGPFLAHFPSVDSAPFTAWQQEQQTRYAERFAQSAALLHDPRVEAGSSPGLGKPQWSGPLNPEPRGQGSAPVVQNTMPNNLPFQLTSFIGRTTAIAELKALLTGAAGTQTSPAPRLITLTGAGGAGKTRLSLQVAAEVLPAFRDGVWLIELAALTEPDLLPVTVAAVLGVRAEADRPLLTTLGEWLQGKQLLLILDNCEHLLDACARLADTLLRASDTFYILASSREALGMGGELRYEVPALAFPVTPLTPLTEEALTQYEAVRLFSERAALVQPAFRVTNANAPAIAQICQRLDGIPLAIELAAAQVKALTVETITARLDDRFQLLVSGNRAALPRHQTLRALIDWSHDLLSPVERVLLRRLAVFAGGWTLEAAETICADPTESAAHAQDRVWLASTAVLDCLTHLVEQSLVILDERGGEPRYRLLETIREYGCKKLREANEGDSLGDSHLTYFLQLAVQAEPHFHGGQRTPWLSRLVAEHGNWGAALAWALAHHPEAAQRLAGLLRWFWLYSDQLTEAQTWYTRLLALPSTTTPTPARAYVLHGAGITFNGVRADHEAQPWLEASMHYWQALNDPAKFSEAVAWLAYVKLCLREAEAVCMLCASHETVLRQSAAPVILAYALTYWGWALTVARRDFATAKRLYEEALLLGQQAQDPIVLGTTYQNFGHWALQQKDYATAKRLYVEALASHRRAGTRWSIGIALYDLADILVLQGDYAEARPFYEEALTLMRLVGRQISVAYILARLGYLALQQGEMATATACLEESLTIYRARPVKNGLTHCLTCYAELHRVQGQAVLAVRLLAVEANHDSPFPLDQLLVERTLDAARAQLSATDFNTAWAAGQQMTLDEALALALTPTPPPLIAE